MCINTYIYICMCLCVYIFICTHTNSWMFVIVNFSVEEMSCICQDIRRRQCHSVAQAPPKLLNQVRVRLPFIVFNVFPVNVQEMFVWSSEGNSIDVHRDVTNYLMKEIFFKKESYGRKRACLFTWRSKQLSYELMLNI